MRFNVPFRPGTRCVAHRMRLGGADLCACCGGGSCDGSIAMASYGVVVNGAGGARVESELCAGETVQQHGGERGGMLSFTSTSLQPALVRQVDSSGSDGSSQQ